MTRSKTSSEEKKMTWTQYVKHKKMQKEREEELKSKGEEVRPGICEKCHKSKFKLKAKDGLLIRTCDNCKAVRTF